MVHAVSARTGHVRNSAGVKSNCFTNPGFHDPLPAADKCRHAPAHSTDWPALSSCSRRDTRPNEEPSDRSHRLPRIKLALHPA